MQSFLKRFFGTSTYYKRALGQRPLRNFYPGRLAAGTTSSEPVSEMPCQQLLPTDAILGLMASGVTRNGQIELDSEQDPIPNCFGGQLQIAQMLRDILCTDRGNFMCNGRRASRISNTTIMNDCIYIMLYWVL
jgi:hypothetical protein